VAFSHQGVVFHLRWFSAASTYGIKIEPIELNPGKVTRDRPGTPKRGGESWLIDHSAWTPLKFSDSVNFWGNSLECNLPGITHFPTYLVPQGNQVVDPRKPVDPNLMIGPLAYGVWDKFATEFIEHKMDGSSTYWHFNLKSIDEVLSFDREKAETMGDYPEFGVSYAEHFDKIAWGSVFMQLSFKLAGKVAKNHGLPYNTELAIKAGIYFQLRTIIARVNTGEDINNFMRQTEIAQLNETLERSDLTFRLGFIG